MQFNSNLLKEKEYHIMEFIFYWARPIRVGDLVKELQYKHSTLNSILDRLQSQGFLKWEKYGLVELTSEGKEFSAHVSNHHFIIERFLKEELNIQEEIAHNEAINLAGVFSCNLIEAICKKLGISHETINTNFCERRDYLSQNRER